MTRYIFPMQPNKKLSVSVILTTYNRAKSLARSIESILNQTLTNFELITVNDGSTDDTQKILDDYVKRDSRIKVLDQQNQGPAAARNAGIRRAKGVYIALMDDDDFSLPKRLEEQWRFLRAHKQYAACTCDYEVRRQDKNLTSFVKNSDTKMAYDAEELLQNPRGPFSLGPMSMFIKTAFVLSGGYRPFFKLQEDLDHTLRFQEKFHIGSVPKCLYIYTHWMNNLRGNLSSSNLTLGLQYDLVAYISALYRRLHHMDPVEAGWSMDDILAQASKLPLPLRKHYLGKCRRTLDVPIVWSSVELQEMVYLANMLRQGVKRRHKKFRRKLLRKLMQYGYWSQVISFLCRG